MLAALMRTLLVLMALLVGCGGSDTTGNTTDATGLCPAQDSGTMVLVVFGQSNSANYLEQRHVASSDNVVSFFDGQCKKAADPLLGATGTQGSVWTLLGNRLTGRGVKRVILVPLGVGDTYIAQWSDGELSQRLRTSLAGVRASGYTVTHFLWHQGENDAGVTSEADYGTRLAAVIATTRESFPSSAFYVSVASYCKPGLGTDPAIQNAQLGTINPAARIYAGPNTDAFIDPLDRYDGCHFSAIAQEKIVALWETILAP